MIPAFPSDRLGQFEMAAQGTLSSIGANHLNCDPGVGQFEMAARMARCRQLAPTISTATQGWVNLRWLKVGQFQMAVDTGGGRTCGRPRRRVRSS